MNVMPEFPEPEDYANGYRDRFGNGAVPIVNHTPPTTTAENLELDRLLLAKDRDASGRGYRFRTFAELSAKPTNKRWLIKGIMARGETSAWIAPPGGMKSALLAQAAICVAAGLDWNGMRNKEAGAVIYFAIERADLVRRRLIAHARILDLSDLPIVVVDATVDLTHPDAFKKLVDTIREVETELRVGVALVVFDTFAKLIAAAGGDENSAKDQGAVFANVQRVKNNAPVHVALIGHTGKDESRGARGSNALLGDVDVMVTLTGDDIRTATVTKANDAPEGVLFSFKSEVFDFGPDEDGDPTTVNIVSSDEVSAQSAPKGREPRLKPNQQTVFAILHGAGSSGLTLEAWNAQAKDVGIGTKRKADLTDIRNALLSEGMVRNYGDKWHVVHEFGGS